MEIQIHMRHYQSLNLQGQPVIYVGGSPQTLQTQVGTVPISQWQDMTSYIGNIEKLRLAWSTQIRKDGENSKGAFEKTLNATGTIELIDAAYNMTREWLVDHVSATMNAIEVKIVIPGCGEFRHLKIGSDQVSWKENDICQLNVTLKQVDEAYKCFEKTLIDDNHMGWFTKNINPFAPNVKKHPRFSYCNEERPNAKLIVTWYLLRTIFDIITMMLVTLAPLINSIIFIINGVILVVNLIIVIINAISTILGTGTANQINTVNLVGFVNPSDVLDNLTNYYIESAGCGREHPAPLIRDYIENVCKKCGIEVDQDSAPIFFNQVLTLTTSANPNAAITIPNHHYRACYLYAPSQRGVRRFDKITWFSNPPHNDYTFYLPENSTLLTGDMFLDKLKGVYNFEWRIKNNKLFIWRRDWYMQNASYIFDFSANGADRSKILDGVEFSWDGDNKQPASAKGIYSLDAADTCGNEANFQANDYISFGIYDNNPNFEGLMDKTTQFGAAKFRLDGAATDYLFDVVQQLLNSMLLNPSTAAQMHTVSQKLIEFADYGLLLKDETCTLPKIIIWDGESYTNAKAVRGNIPMSTSLASAGVPEINYNYPVSWDSNAQPIHQEWKDRHPPLTHVLGEGLYWGATPTGVYTAGVYFSGTPIYQQPARLVNFPMYFEAHYKGTLWDLFHWIDDPRRNPSFRQNFSVVIPLCCEDLEELGVLNGAENISLLEKVKLDRQYYPDGLITEIELVFDSTDEFGKHIVIKGKG